MGIKCSLLGHKFGESTVERDREEQGSEVIITIEETETCERCGETRVVSQNKEVTSLEMPDDVGDESDGTDATDPDDTAETATGSESPETGATAASEPGTEESPDPVTEAEASETEEEPPVTDDAEILDDDGIDRAPGEWPQEADSETDHDEEDFDQYGYMDEEATVDEEATDAEFIDDESTDPEDVDAVEETPPADAETNAWPSEAETEESSEQGPPTGPGAVTVPDGEFVCRACGFSTPVEESSLREGDFCPECHKETLVQVRER